MVTVRRSTSALRIGTVQGSLVNLQLNLHLQCVLLRILCPSILAWRRDLGTLGQALECSRFLDKNSGVAVHVGELLGCCY